MATVSFKTTEDRIQSRLNDMIAKGRDASAILNTTIMDMYFQAQVIRWQTENSSEGAQWANYASKNYAIYKQKKYASFPEGGRRKMIATGHLIKVATGQLGMGGALKKVVTPNRLTVSIDDGETPYAKYVAKDRPIMAFGTDTRTMMRLAIGKYMMGKS